MIRFNAVIDACRAQQGPCSRTLEAYPEVQASLRALSARGLRTGILSNGDPAMLNAAVASAGLGPQLDAVLSVDAAGVFKTSPRTYDLVLQAFSLNVDEVVFVSSNRWDIAGAAAFGFHPVWVNRLGMPDEYPALKPGSMISTLSSIV